MTQRLLLAFAVVSGLFAGGLYYAGSQRVNVVVAARDLDATHAIGADDIEMRAFPADAVPAGAVADPHDAIGRTPRAPLSRGQLLFSRGLASGAAMFHSGIEPPAGTRAVALPVNASQAVGGAVAAGERVDIVAVPLVGKAPAGRSPELIARAALVLDVRSESGGEFRPAASAGARGIASATYERIGSVVVAIGPGDELRFADRIATSAFVLVLVPR